MDGNNQRQKGKSGIQKSIKYRRQATEMYDMCGFSMLRREGKPWDGISILNYNPNKTFLK